MKHSALNFLLIISALALQTTALARPDPAINIGQLHTLHSTILDEDRDLLIYLPNGYQSHPDRRYPLFVVLDGRMNFKATASTIHSLAEGGAIPRMVVVGVTNTNRWRDLTPIPGMGIPGTGGGEDFLAYLQDELMPWMDSQFRLNGFKAISGHSLGGLTTLQILQQAPELFDAYMSLSPSLEWGDGFMVDRLARRFGQHRSLEKMLYLAIADEQMERPYYDDLVTLLKSFAPQDMRWTSELFEQYDDHMSIRVTAGIAGIRWIFRDWRLTSAQIAGLTDNQVENHYAAAARRYKQPRTWGLMDMTNAAYWGLYDESRRDRAMHLFRLAVERWPDSAYAWSCLGEGLERTGNLSGALKEMEKALAMAIAANHQDLPYFQGMVDRVRGKLGKLAESSR